MWVRLSLCLASYCHHWDLFGTGVVFISYQEQCFPLSCIWVAVSSQRELDWCDTTTIGFGTYQQREVMAALTSTASQEYNFIDGRLEVTGIWRSKAAKWPSVLWFWREVVWGVLILFVSDCGGTTNDDRLKRGIAWKKDCRCANMDKFEQ